MRWIVLALALNAYSAVGQENFQFPISGVSWTSLSVGPIQGVNDAYQVHETLLEGDTILDGMTYLKLQSVLRCDCICPNPNPSSNWRNQNTFSTQHDFLRVEGSKYFLRNRNGIEFLRYDFSLELGDSLNLDGKLFFIEAVSLDAIGRKNIRISTKGSMPFKENWIEGIGSLSGPLVLPQWTFSVPYVLSACFSPSIPSECETPCQSTTSVIEHQMMNELQIAPVPAANFISVNIGFDSPVHIEIFTLNGHLVLTKLSVGHGEQIDISNLKSGAYIVIAKSDQPNKFYKGKFVKL
jgi:hypothetical protein